MKTSGNPADQGLRENLEHCKGWTKVGWASTHSLKKPHEQCYLHA